MIFFNERGDEVGGLAFHGDSTADGYTAGGHFAFNPFRQDQVVSLQYADDGSSRQAGVLLWDRSTETPISRVLGIVDSQRRADGPARDSIQAEIECLTAEGGLGANRIFLGSRDRAAQLVLADAQGRPRIRLVVDASGTARLEFLDAAGATVAVIPQ
jgi:hypothetical protein